MNHRSLSILFSLSLALGACCHDLNPDCRWSATVSEVTRSLVSTRDDVRRNAARALRTRQGVPARAIRPLVHAVREEDNLDVRGEMVVTLGHSGAAVAIPHIEAMLRSSHPDARRYGADALWAWRVAHGLEEHRPRPHGWHMP